MSRNDAIRNLGVLDGYLARAIFSDNGPVDQKVKVYPVGGHNPNVTSGTREDVWMNGGFYTYLTTALMITCVSTSAQDAPGGTGIKTIFIDGLDANYDPVSEFLELNGLSSVDTVNSYIRVQQIFAVNSDDPDPNTTFVGTFTASAGATVQQVIMPGETISSNSSRTVPNGYQGVVTQGNASSQVGLLGDFTIDFMVRRQGNIFVTAVSIDIAAGNTADLPFNPFLGRLPGKSDVKAVALSSSANAHIKVQYTIMAIRDDYFNSLLASV